MAFLTRQEAARFLAIPIGTLDSWRWSGRGPTHVRLSHKSVVYDEIALKAFAQARTVEPSVQAFMEERRGTLQEAR